MLAPKLKKGDGVRVIAPARSLMLPWMSQELKDLAKDRLEELGLEVSFGKYVNEMDEFSSSTVAHRLEDLHEAFSDESVALILTVIGGFNSNQLLREIDYELIKKRPKIFCGFSDITALSNAIYAKTNLVTYYGPHFFNFGQKINFDYTLSHFKKCLFSEKTIEIESAANYVDEYWATNQDNVELFSNPGWKVFCEGNAEGTIIGGNLGTFFLLHGTEYLPSPKGNIILFLEDDREEQPWHVDRLLQAILHQPLIKQVRGLVIGRFEKESHVTDKLLKQVLESKPELRGIPIVSGVDFGHTTPMITFPIGGKASISADKNSCAITILEH